ncbi:HAD family phosphatase [Albibacterium sp.]|uniref:HAD family hydrolase n=1 Tax=Albibacterium sp. TaxID=2952885 RepID=UPI002BFC2B15|nr:HAD family phosphatase [Albibacterium sp.]HUH19233.1 HAD family phosphatase [Albibacterium sp.]
MRNINNIIFDYGNVIFQIDFMRAKQAFQALGIQDADSFFSHKEQHALFDKLDTGKISAAEFYEGIRGFSGGRELSDEQIRDAWNALLIGVPKGNHEVLLEMKSKYRTFLLSNNNEIHYRFLMDYLKKDYGIADNSGFFEKDYYSHLMGMRKPNREIFEFVINKQNLVPEETLFIDDSPQHLQTAKELGLQTVLSTSADSFQELIKGLKL